MTDLNLRRIGQSTSTFGCCTILLSEASRVIFGRLKEAIANEWSILLNLSK